MDILKARKVIFIDIPILIAHSFIYYRICYNLSVKKYEMFYFDYIVLLILNSVWIYYINIRLKKDGAKTPDKFDLWFDENRKFRGLFPRVSRHGGRA